MGYKVNPPTAEELRQLAISRVAGTVVPDGASLTGEQAKKLLEELAISKIEVEIQNVHLQDTCARLDGSLNEFTDIYDFAPIACMSTDEAGRITKLNLACAGFFGLERNSLMGHLFFGFFPPEQSDALQALMYQAVTTGQDQQSDLPIGSGKSSVQQVQLWLSHKGAGRGFQLVLNDITARKALEDDLRACKERMKFALDATSDGMWDWDVAANTLRFSPRLAQLYGYGEVDGVDGMAGWRERVHPEDWAGLLHEVQKCLSGQEQRFGNTHRSRCADGSWKWILCQGAVFRRDAAGRVLRMLGTHSDISPRKCMEEELQQVRGLHRALFDSFPQYLAVLDAQGRVLQTNDLWNAFGLANGFAYRNGFVQVEYTVLLDALTRAHAHDRRAALEGIGDVIEGRVPSFQLEYAAGSGAKARRFIMHVMAVREGLAKAVVSHLDVSRLVAVPEALASS